MLVHGYHGYDFAGDENGEENNYGDFWSDLAAAGAKQYPLETFLPNSGWPSTRASGLLAALISLYDLTWPEIWAWCHANDLDDWEINLDQSDSATTLSGDIYFDQDYPWTSEAQTAFKSWSGGQTIATLPDESTVPSATPAAAPVAPQPAPVAPQPAPVSPATAPVAPPSQSMPGAPVSPAAAPVAPQPAPVAPGQQYAPAAPTAPGVAPAPVYPATAPGTVAPVYPGFTPAPQQPAQGGGATQMIMGLLLSKLLGL